MAAQNWRYWITFEPGLAFRFARFVLTGLLNTAFGYGIFAAGVNLGLRPEVALAFATALGIPFNFVSMGKLVFGHSRVKMLPRFFAVYVVTFGINALVLRVLIDFGLSPLLAQLLLLPLFAVVIFLAMQQFVFKVAERR